MEKNVVNDIAHHTVFNKQESEILQDWLDKNSHHCYPKIEGKSVVVANSCMRTTSLDKRKSPYARDRYPQRIMRENFSKAQVEILSRWARTNWQCPYPTSEDKIHLAIETKLTYDQIQNWFCKWRLRVWEINPNESKFVPIIEHKLEHKSEDKKKNILVTDEPVTDEPATASPPKFFSKEVIQSWSELSIKASPVVSTMLRTRLSDFRLSTNLKE